MTITKTDLKFIVPFFVYVIPGFSGAYTYEYVDNLKALNLAFSWFIVPSVVLGIIYSYYSVFKRGPRQAQWRNVLALFALTLIYTLLFLRSSQGYLVLWNAYVGHQDEVIVRGTVSKLDYPKVKKPLNSYAIFIELDSTNKKINLDVPSNSYLVGQAFVKKMKKGSLGILYSR